MSTLPLNVMIVDDEMHARARLRVLLEDIAPECLTQVVGEAETGMEALALLQGGSLGRVDVVLSDIHMPVMDGLELAGHLGGLAEPPLVIFTTAYDNHAIQAFELEAVDYLLKPVRAQRLQAALEKARNRLPRIGQEQLLELGQRLRGGGRTHLPCHERGRLLLVPVVDVLYFKADLKYVTARTGEREYILDETLSHLEEEFHERYIRLHRSILAARLALSGFERAAEDEEAYGWALLRGVDEKLPVSRRQWAVAKGLAGGGVDGVVAGPEALR